MSRTADRRKRVRFAPIALIAGLAGAATLGLSTTGTLSTFTASILNGSNAATAATLTMQETDTNNHTCTSTGSANTVSCGVINKFGGNVLLPGSAGNSVQVTIANTGSATVGSFTLTPGACTPSTTSGAIGTADPCAKMNLVLTATPTGGTATQLYNGTIGNFATTYGTTPLGITGANIPTPNSASTTTFTFTVTLPSGSDNTYQGRIATVPLTWAFSAGS